MARFLVLILALCSCAHPAPEARAVAFLSREVPDWPLKNKCYSCHNNGDAARALFTAQRMRISFDPAALESTARWLRRPAGWKDNGPQVEYSDKKLATLQFAHALTEADAPEALREAADQVRDLQEKDGSWAVDVDGLPGSPVTYGRTLATVVARRIFLAADPRRYEAAIARAEGWLRARKPAGVLEAGALLMAGCGDPNVCLDLIRKGQSSDGGWGSFATSPPENFDTSIVLLGLAALKNGPEQAEFIRSGRDFLIRAQLTNGSWPETTRPPGAESYAQRISTTGWATLALLATSKARRAD